MKFKTLVPALFLSILTASCNQNQGNATITVDTLMTDAAETEALLKNAALDFEGVLPCADCPGITTSLHLNRDSLTYYLTETYQSKSDSVFINSGSYKMMTGADSVMQIIELTQIADKSIRYFELMGDSAVIALDQNARRIQSDLNYTLRKR